MENVRREIKDLHPMQVFMLWPATFVLAVLASLLEIIFSVR